MVSALKNDRCVFPLLPEIRGKITETAFSIPAMAIEPHMKYPVAFLNDRAGDITGAAAVSAPGFVAPRGLTGEGQIVAIADSGLDTGRLDDIHPDLRSVPGKMPKIVLLKSWAGRDVPDDPDGHGTHMAATVAGTGAASGGKFRGIAPGAGIYFQAILNQNGEPEPPDDLSELFWPAYSAGARVHVDGWGGGPNTYTERAAQVDDFVREHPDFLAIFGAGNNGRPAGAITAEANSKNALAVGASVLPRPAFNPGTDDTAAPADFSSRGPAGDGRIKPELLAPASAVISACSRLVDGNLPGYPAYTRMQGTSMAAAVAGGSAALLREYFKKHMDVPAPSAALIKAALVNGARPAAGDASGGGFGVMDLAGTVIALKDGSFRLADEWAGVSGGQEISYTFRVADASAPFKATLAWTDPPAGQGSTQTLINDLDLVVRAPDGRFYYGNHFLGKNVPDRVNNVEQVYLPDPAPGEYTVLVTGAAVRRNVLSGAAVPVQDFALVWGQPPAESVVEDVEGGKIVLADGTAISPAGRPLTNLINGAVAPGDAGHLFPGAQAYRTEKGIYLAARLWRAAGIKALKTPEGVTFTEINPEARLGGYGLAPDAEIVLNNRLATAGELPAGIEVTAVVNPADQKIRQVRAAFTERDGVVASVRSEDGRKTISLEGGGGTYRISPGAVFNYEDSYAGIETADTLFGTGALEELVEVLPGMPVHLHLAPASGEVQYLAVKRRVLLGTVVEVNPAGGGIRMENGFSCRLFPGAPVRKDRESADLAAVRPGDHAAAVLLPDTGEAIGLVAYSSVLYGRAIDYIKKDRTLYLLDDEGRYRTFRLPPEAVIYRWGVKVTPEAIASGLRVRITADAAGNSVWRLDIADTLYTAGVLREYDREAGAIVTADGRRYRVSDLSRFYVNGCPVLPEDLKPGGDIEIEYYTAPQISGSLLLSASGHSSEPSPALFFSVVPLQGQLVLTGRTGTGTTVYLWRGAEVERPAADGSGRFSCPLRQDVGEGDFTLVAVNKATGGVNGMKVSLPDGDAEAFSPVTGAMAGVLGRTGGEGGRGQIERPQDAPLKRAEAVAALARLLNWPAAGNWPLVFVDTEDIPAEFQPAVGDAWAHGVIKGYPDRRFLPSADLSRAEAAVILSAVLRDLGLEAAAGPAPPFADAGDIPPWAAGAVSRVAAAGMFAGRAGGAFAPAEPVTVEEMTGLLEELLAACEAAWP